MTEAHYTDDAVTLHHGDCLDVLRGMPDSSVDAIVTDPPAGISFMSKSWDHDLGGRTKWVAWMTEVMTEALRVIRPGGHALVWALPRTSHWTSWAIESAGFDVRDCIVHIFGTGFPKSLDVSKAIDKCGAVDIIAFKADLANMVSQSGFTRTEVDLRCGFTMRFDVSYVHDPVGWGVSMPSPDKWSKIKDVLGCDDRWDALIHAQWRGRSGAAVSNNGSMAGDNLIRTTKGAPVTLDAATWAGWGTALKPASEHWWLARKPLAGTVAGNVLRYGTGALNIDATRVGADILPERTAGQSKIGTFKRGVMVTPERVGRWPANVVLSHTEWCVEVGTRQARTGTAVNRNRTPDNDRATYAAYSMGNERGGDVSYGTSGAETVAAWDCPEGCPVRELDAQSGGDTSGASRFFQTFRDSAPTMKYEAKAPTFERPGYEHEDGLQEATTVGAGMRVRQCVQCGSRGKPAGGEHSEKPWPTCGHDDWTMVETIRSANRVAHPTVKPLDLMRWLVRLVTPPGGTVLDLFAGSGTTGEACIVEGFKCVLIEREAAYLPLIVARLSKPIQPDLFGGAA